MIIAKEEVSDDEKIRSLANNLKSFGDKDLSLLLGPKNAREIKEIGDKLDKVLKDIEQKFRDKPDQRYKAKLEAVDNYVNNIVEWTNEKLKTNRLNIGFRKLAEVGKYAGKYILAIKNQNKETLKDSYKDLRNATKALLTSAKEFSTRVEQIQNFTKITKLEYSLKQTTSAKTPSNQR